MSRERVSFKDENRLVPILQLYKAAAAALAAGSQAGLPLALSPVLHLLGYFLKFD